MDEIAGLSWVDNGTTDLEAQGVDLLMGLATSSPRGFQRLILKSWLHDGLTQAEVELLKELREISARTDIDAEDLIVRVLLMPFLETVEESDLDAMAVFGLPWIEDGLVTLKSYLKPLQAIAVESPKLGSSIGGLARSPRRPRIKRLFLPRD